eukprot:SAG22_NODE_4_length_44774_cov_362.122149_39_plen_70_part_00
MIAYCVPGDKPDQTLIISGRAHSEGHEEGSSQDAGAGGMQGPLTEAFIWGRSKPPQPAEQTDAVRTVVA